MDTQTVDQTQTQQPTSHTVVQGDTLSGIGAKYGMNWQDIYNNNKGVVGPNPNLIRPGQVLQLSQNGASQPNTTPFKLSIPNTVDSSTLRTIMQNPITNQDLQDTIASNKALGTKIGNEETPTSTETQLSNQLSDLRAHEDASKLSLQKYEGNLPTEGISTDAIHGRSSSMARDVNLDLQTMALQEKNLMARLGIETATRKGELAADQTTQKTNQQTISNYESMQRIIDSEKNAVATESSKLEASSRSTLNTILTHFKGLDYQDLSPDGQKQITDLSTQSGLPLDTVIKGMAANKSQTQLNVLQKQNAILKQEQSLHGKTPTKPVISGKLKVTSSQIGELSTALESHKGSDGYVDTGVYTKALSNWAKAGGLEKDFYAKFPPKSYLNPNDPSVQSKLKAMLPKSSTGKKTYGG